MITRSKPLARARLARRERRKAKVHNQHFTDGRTFADSRSRVLPKTGRVILRGRDMTELRREVYRRSGGHCEAIKSSGKRCNKFAAWDGFGKGELSHIPDRAHQGSDVPAETIWSCRECHARRHPGPQFAPQRRRVVETDGNSAEPAA